MIEVKLITQMMTEEFQALYRALEKPRAANRAVAAELFGWTIRNFDSEGGSVGGWAPLKDATRLYKEKRGKTKMLVDSSLLRNTIHQFYDDDEAGVGSPVPYSIYHQKGTRFMPARPFLPDQDTALEIGLKVYDAYIKGVIK